MENTEQTAMRDTWTRRLTARLFQQDDAAAARHGWQIRAGGGGRSRIYRDPRFDRLASCGTCGGNEAACAECAGTGRVSLTLGDRARTAADLW